MLNDFLLGLLFDPEDRSDPSNLSGGLRVIYSSEYCITEPDEENIVSSST
jgi:hypothetical protein